MVLVGVFDVCLVFRLADTSVSACCFAVIIIVLNDLGAQSRCLFKDHGVDGLKEFDCRSAIEPAVGIKIGISCKMCTRAWNVRRCCSEGRCD